MKSKILFLFIVVVFNTNIFSQSILNNGIRYYPIPAEFQHSSDKKEQWDSSLEEYLKIAKYVDDIKESNLDENLLLQEILDLNDVVTLPNRVININSNGLRLKSNQVLIFQEKTVIHLQPNAKTHFAVIIVDEVENVKIFKPKIVGERFQHLDSKGQWGMGIRIIASKNVQIYNPVISEMWGDGIYIGGRKGVPSKKIDIYNAFLDNNRRNALSITSADGVRLIKPLVANSNGQSPKAGIDIEPNTNLDVINNIIIDRPISYYNSIYGIVVSLTRLSGSIPKEVNIQINEPLIYGGKYGLAILGLTSNKDNYKINGSLKVKNLTSYYTALTFKKLENLGFNVDIDISNFKIYHKSKRGIDYLNLNQIEMFETNLKNLNKF